MFTNRFALVAMVLWIATVAVFAWFFVRGNTTAGTDGRTAVVLAPAERDLVLGEMRGLLSASQQVVLGIRQGDMKLVAKSARAAGMASAADVNPALMAKLPVAFKSLGMSVHRDMDDLALAAESGKGQADLLGMLSDTMSKCVACHSAWQLQPVQ
ncbi:hypothetical protein MIZ01_1122 [Sideroxyarcus emersonii]|uniref:Cytochrome c n=1 Tax=Sideroxyarcus emersonii TaxID=2764705 RepID=A0AAN1XA05_9PROT|nr:hypothetical protein [Sideroxyarcus emersonii]BCK87344.1 hypothetical protein MIZ01_1122 [Sideroxyarcus emersonii]